MSKKLATNVTVEGTTYKAGTVPPAEVAQKIDHPRAWATDDAKSAAPEVEDKGYSGMKPDELQALADERELEVTGTGANDKVLKGDLVKALEDDDAAKAS